MSAAPSPLDGPAPVRGGSARVIVVSGPSGSGKTRLARQLGLPVLNLDDFYKDGDDPTLPTVDLAGGSAIVDWDDPRSWNADAGVAAICALCSDGSLEVPVYDIAKSRATGTQRLDLGDAAYFLAEGIFAHAVVASCRERGVLADAVCLTQHPLLTFVRRLWRDLRERRKPPTVLVRRGLHLMREQRGVVATAVAHGCRPLSGDTAYAELAAMVRGDVTSR